MSGAGERMEGSDRPRWIAGTTGDRRDAERSGGQDEAAGADRPPDRPADGDEILRTSYQARPAPPEPEPAAPERAPAGWETGGGRRAPQLAEAAHRYQGWVPSGELLTAGEVFAAAIVAELACLMLAVGLAAAQRWTELPEPLARHPILSAVLGGLAIGFYVLLRRRGRRVARRKHLRGEG
jgi:hypothetical protein